MLLSIIICLRVCMARTDFITPSLFLEALMSGLLQLLVLAVALLLLMVMALWPRERTAVGSSNNQTRSHTMPPGLEQHLLWRLMQYRKLILCFLCQSEPNVLLLSRFLEYLLMLPEHFWKPCDKMPDNHYFRAEHLVLHCLTS